MSGGLGETTRTAATRPLRRMRLAKSVLKRLPIRGKRTVGTCLRRFLAPELSVVQEEISGVRMHLDLQDRIQLWMFLELYDQEEFAVLRAMLQPGDCFLDIGANIGYYTFQVCQMIGETGQVHAFEPVPANAAQIRDTVGANSLCQVRVVEAAVSDISGEIRLSLPEAGSESGWATAVEVTGGRKISVPCLTVDSYLAGLPDPPPAIRAAKLDIEGYEPCALRGMSETIGRYRPALLIEINQPMLSAAGSSPMDILEALRPYGYSARIVDRRGCRTQYDFQPCEKEVFNIIAEAT